jgi:peroxiredoxin family protein
MARSARASARLRAPARAAAPDPFEVVPAALASSIRRHVREEVARALAEERKRTNRATLVVFSGELDRVLASLVIATGAAAMGLEVSMCFTFWGLSVLKRSRRLRRKDVMARALAMLTPAGLGALGVSKMNLAGLGAGALRRRMRATGVASPEELFALARESGVRLVACSMSMDLMGIERDELLDGVEVGGVATYLADASDSRVTLFV